MKQPEKNDELNEELFLAISNIMKERTTSIAVPLIINMLMYSIIFGSILYLGSQFTIERKPNPVEQKQSQNLVQKKE